MSSTILNIELKAPNWLMRKFSIGYDYEVYFIERMDIIHFTNNPYKFKKERIMVI